MRDVAPPTRPWVGTMRWCDLAFLHWPLAPRVVQPLVPAGLQLDLFDGHAWIGVVPFRMEGVRVRGIPPLPTIHAFPELNVRTYVRAGDRAGVWFFSLDAGSRLAVRAARALYNLPYYDAQMHVTSWPQSGLGPTIAYESRRTHRGALPAVFRARYEPVGEIYEPVPGTLDHFLVERYCLFTFSARRGLRRLDVDHQPWQLQRATVDVMTNTMGSAAAIELPHTPPVAHFSRALDVRAWTPVTS